VSFSPDFSLVATGSYDHSAKLWDLKTGRELATLGGHADIVSDLVFSSDGKSLVTIGGEGEIKVWDVTTMINRNIFIKNPRPSWRLGVSPGEHALAALDFAGALHVWDRISGTETYSIQTGESEIFPDVTFAPNGKSLAWMANKSLGILDLESGRRDTYTIRGNESLRGIAFSPDGREIAFSSHTNVMLCDLQTRRFHPFTSFGEEISALRYSPDGALLAFGHEHGGVSLWDRKTGKKLTEHSGVHVFLTSGLAFSANGHWLATAGSQTINLWPVTPKGLGRPRTFTAHVGYIPAVAFSPDATRLVSASSDHTLKFWNTTDGTEVGILYGHDSCVSDVLFSRDGNTIFSNGQDGTIRIWEAAPRSHSAKKADTRASTGTTVYR
jgi:WD40 repeat protein